MKMSHLAKSRYLKSWTAVYCQYRPKELYNTVMIFFLKTTVTQYKVCQGPNPLCKRTLSQTGKSKSTCPKHLKATFLEACTIQLSCPKFYVQTKMPVMPLQDTNTWTCESSIDHKQWFKVGALSLPFRWSLFHFSWLL